MNLTTDTLGKSELARGGALSFVGSATSAVMGLLLIVVLGRMLGDAGTGVVLQVIAVFTIALGVARFGMDSTAIWILPRQLDDDPAQVRSTAWFLIAVSGVAGALTAGVLLFSAHLAGTANPGDPVAEAVRATALFLPIASMLLTTLSVTRALGRVTAYVFVGNIAVPIMRPIAVVTAVGLGAGLTGAAVAWALPLAPAMIAAFAVFAAYSRRHSPGGVWGPRRAGTSRRALSYALPRLVSSSLEQLLLWVAVIVVGGIAGPVAAAVYGAASRFIAAGMIVDSALRVVVAPMFSRLLHRSDGPGLEKIYRTATVWLVLFSAPVYLLLMVFAPVALSVIGDSFVAGAMVLAIMCGGALITFLAGNIHSVLLMSGHSGLAAANKAVVVAVNIGLLYLLVPAHGIVGAAVAWCIACVLDAALATVEVRLILRLQISPAAGLYPLFVGIVSVGAPAVACRFVFGATWIGLGVAAAFGGALFLAWCRMDRNRLQLAGLTLRIREERRPVASGKPRNSESEQTGSKGN
ncbi:MAG: flippase [Leucobacter sp.]